MEKTVCELFAGVGGFRLGLERSDSSWRTVWFSQWEPMKKKQWAHECYVRHFGDIAADTGIDIALVDKERIPEHTLLVGGFPCQNYSVAASKSSKGIEGEKGVLWWQIRDVLIAKKPPFVLLENVDRLLKSPASQRGRDFGIMLTCFEQLGYTVEWRVINAADYGAAQRRRRIFIFACSGDTRQALAAAAAGAEAVVAETGLFPRAFPVAGIASPGREVPRSLRLKATDLSGLGRDEVRLNPEANRELLDMTESFSFPFAGAGCMIGGNVFTCDVIPASEPPTPLSAVLEENADEKYVLSGDSLEKWAYLKGAKRIERTAKNGHRYVFSEGPIAFPDPADRPSRTMLTSESSLNRSTHVVADPGSGKYRLLTPVETERLQGFPDGWTDTGMPEKFRYFCMGNALVVPMITRMGRVINEMIEAEG